MLFRDTAATNFEQCGRTELPITGAVMQCATKAMAAKQPFVVQVAGPIQLSPQRLPAVVAADFGEGYVLRMYQSERPGFGERGPVDLMMTSHDANALSVMPSAKARRRCLLSAAEPTAAASAKGSSWTDAGPHRKVNAAQCVEWFDAAAWSEQPWDARFDPAQGFACEG